MYDKTFMWLLLGGITLGLLIILILVSFIVTRTRRTFLYTFLMLLGITSAIAIIIIFMVKMEADSIRYELPSETYYVKSIKTLPNGEQKVKMEDDMSFRIDNSKVYEKGDILQIKHIKDRAIEVKLVS